MIVLDASALMEVLLSSPPGIRIADRIAASADVLGAPALIDAEVLHALRRMVRQGEVGRRWADLALDTLRTFPITRMDQRSLLQRAWALRNSVSAYDAMYIALAEAHDARLITLDGRLAGSHGHHAAIEYFGS